MPTTTPTISVKANAWMISPPKMNKAISTSRVVPLVIKVRASVWFTEVLTTWTGVLFRMRGKFSRMRSNTTMVSFSE